MPELDPEQIKRHPFLDWILLLLRWTSPAVPTWIAIPMRMHSKIRISTLDVICFQSLSILWAHEQTEFLRSNNNFWHWLQSYLLTVPCRSGSRCSCACTRKSRFRHWMSFVFKSFNSLHFSFLQSVDSALYKKITTPDRPPLAAVMLIIIRTNSILRRPVEEATAWRE